MGWFKPDWPLPNNIQSLCTTRDNGVSTSPWDSFNLATHVNDDLIAVKQNRQTLKQDANLPSEPEWLNQTHSIKAVELENTDDRQADASITRKKNVIAVVLTADCLPLLICNKQGTEVAAVHAGWKGLLDGIVIKTIQSMQSNPEDLLIWLGPAISQKNFEIGDEVKQQFCDQYNNAEQYFIAMSDNKYMADLYGLVRQQLNDLNVNSIYGGDFCSYAQHEKFYSYRRDKVTGRMASLIWIKE